MNFEHFKRNQNNKEGMNAAEDKKARLKRTRKHVERKRYKIYKVCRLLQRKIKANRKILRNCTVKGAEF